MDLSARFCPTPNTYPLKASMPRVLPISKSLKEECNRKSDEKYK
jgi:hypothetical protein